jgi:hypothetical protein
MKDFMKKHPYVPLTQKTKKIEDLTKKPINFQITVSPLNHKKENKTRLGKTKFGCISCTQICDLSFSLLFPNKQPFFLPRISLL